MEQEFSAEAFSRRMEGAVAALRQDLASLRTGRASAAMLDPVVVPAYGGQMPLPQCATVTVPDPRTIAVNVWDKGLVGAVEKALRESGLGVNPIVDGTLIRVPIPDLNEERRREFTKVAGSYAETARIAVRNVRRDAMDRLRKARAEGMSEDEHKVWSGEIQALTDRFVGKIDAMLESKRNEIMTV